MKRKNFVIALICAFSLVSYASSQKAEKIVNEVVHHKQMLDHEKK